MSEAPVQTVGRGGREISAVPNESGLGPPSRRAWIQGSAATLTILFSGSQLRAQEAPLSSTLQSMSSVVGSRQEDKWLEPVAALVNAILEDSKPLRALDLGSIEPSTCFRAD